MTEKKWTLLNYGLIAVAFAFGFYLACGEFIFGNNPTRPFQPWEISLVLSVLCLSFGALVAINIIRKKYHPNYVLLGLLSLLFISNLITILLFKDKINYSFVGIDDEIRGFEFHITSFMRFSYIAEHLAMLLMVVLILDICHQVVDGKALLRNASLVILLVMLVFMFLSFILEGNKYINLISHLGKDDVYNYSANSVFKSKNNYAYILNLGIMSSIVLHNQDKKWYWLALAGFLYVNILFTLCKFLIILDALLILAYLIYRFFVTYKENKKRNLIALASVGGAIILAIILLIILLAVKGKLNSLIELVTITKGYDTLETRTWIWRHTGFVVSNSNAFTGAGYNLYSDLLFNYNIFDLATHGVNETRSAHSGYVQYFGEGGILMILIFVFIAAILIYTAIKNLKNNQDLIVISLIFFTFSLIYMVIESGSIIFARAIENGAAALLTFVPILAVNSEFKKPIQ